MQIDPKTVIPINHFEELICDPVYAHDGNAQSPLTNYFPSLYRPDVKIIWGHRDIVSITLLAAKFALRN